MSAYNLLKADDLADRKPKRRTLRESEVRHRISEFCSDCRAIVSYWLSGGSISVDFRRDCLVISGRPRG
jgi:hypothetical protein